MRKIAIVLALAAAAFGTEVANATWLEASTDHFVIDADTSEPRLRDFAIRLERFDAALRKLYGVGDDPARKADRVRVFAIGTGTMRRLTGSAAIRGFYERRPGRSLIFTAALAPPTTAVPELGTRIVTAKSLDLDPLSTLLHEYSHHFMYANFPSAYPAWFSEGFAEFNGNARFNDDRSVTIGAAPLYRAYGLSTGNVPITTLLDPPKGYPATAADADAFYGRAWLLTHYLMVEGQRQDALNRYLNALRDGKPSLEAARDSFGDLKALDKAANGILWNKQFSGLGIGAPASPPTVAVATLSPGMAAVLPVRLQSARGVSPAQAPGVADEAERLAAAYPNDASAQAALAEAEFDAKRDDKADAAADRALAAEPANVPALLYKGRVAARRMQGERSADAAGWARARSWFVRANHASPDAAEPLLLYYESFGWAGQPAPDVAYQGLRRAQELAPEADEIRLALAARMIDGGDVGGARSVLRPIAYSPHEPDGRAVKALEALDAHRPEEARAALADTLVK